MNTLTVRGLTTEFHTEAGVLEAIRDVSFEVREGQIVGVVGESGSGKSVTLRSLIGLVQPPGHVVAGEVHLADRDLRRMSRSELRRVRGAEIGFVGQSPFASLNPILRIGRQFRNIARAHGRRDAMTKEFALERLHAVGIADPEQVLSGYAHQLSGGMAQRVVIALAMSMDPRLLIADEPTTALDVTVQRQILDLMRDLVSTSGGSMLLVTHDLTVVSHYCDWVVVMYAGEIVEQGPVRRIYANPGHPYTRALYGSVPRQDVAPKLLTKGPPRGPADRPSGCVFRDACPSAFDRCIEQPAPHPVEGGGAAACHLLSGVLV